jgi:5,10-methenyltetrahydrofolate synthetase
MADVDDNGRDRGAGERRRALRAALIAAREALPAAEHARLSGLVEGHLANLLARLEPKVIGWCWPYRAEFDCRALVGRWLAGGRQRRAGLAVVVATASPLAFRRWTPRSPLVAGLYGIPVPRSGPVLAPDLLLLPLNGFDEAGYRLGYGGGYFDRTLAAADPAPTSVGVGFELARLASIAPGPHDLPLDYVVTEAGVTKRDQGGLASDGGAGSPGMHDQAALASGQPRNKA